MPSTRSVHTFACRSRISSCFALPCSTFTCVPDFSSLRAAAEDDARTFQSLRSVENLTGLSPVCPGHSAVAPAEMCGRRGIRTTRGLTPPGLQPGPVVHFGRRPIKSTRPGKGMKPGSVGESCQRSGPDWLSVAWPKSAIEQRDVNRFLVCLHSHMLRMAVYLWASLEETALPATLRPEQTSRLELVKPFHHRRHHGC